MKWNKTPKEQVEVGLNQELQLECDATGSPEPLIEWIKHSALQAAQERSNFGDTSKSHVQPPES